jgi:hypothetical protein
MEAPMTTRWWKVAMIVSMLAGLAAGAQAAPPTFRVSQVFTTIDGSTQFVELTEFAGLNGQHQWRGLTLTMTFGDRVRTLTFDEDLPTAATAHMTVVLTTFGYYDFAALAKDGAERAPALFDLSGGTAFYYGAPARFLDPRGGTLDFAGVDKVALPALPVDGLRSYYRDGTPAAASYPNRCETGPCGRSPFSVQATPIYEFYHAGMFAFLPTVDALEIEALLDGRVPGWRPSEQFFTVRAAPKDGFDAPVCRYYTPGGGHVLSAFASECALLGAPGSGFILEAAAAFYVALPDPATGACATGAPVYRFWNSANGADHRYTLFGKTLDLSVGPLQGYVREGYGPDGVAFCVDNYFDDGF